MNEILQDLLVIDCSIQNGFQSLLATTSRAGLDTHSNEIKQNIREFKDKLKEMKEYCDAFTPNTNSGGLMSKLSRSSAKNEYSEMLNSSPKDVFINELQIQKERLSTIETRFRNSYLAVQVKLDQIERDALVNSSNSSDTSSASSEVKKRNLNNQILLKQSNQMTNKLSDINRQLKWTENQTGDIIPVLDESSKLLKNTSQEFGYMKTAITDGRRLLTRLDRREFTDKLLIILCLCFFFSVVLYIFCKRFF
jgi:uncharacterized protein YhaN